MLLNYKPIVTFGLLGKIVQSHDSNKIVSSLYKILYFGKSMPRSMSDVFGLYACKIGHKNFFIKLQGLNQTRIKNPY